MVANIVFFQAAATVIPTLLIAVVVGARFYDRSDLTPPPDSEERVENKRVFSAWWSAHYSTLVAGVVGLSIAMYGEYVALRALARGRGLAGEQRPVASAVATLLAAITLATLRPTAIAMTTQAAKQHGRDKWIPRIAVYLFYAVLAVILLLTIIRL